ncbi:neural cell adhesion molecule 1-like isoform X3 [Dreissena polymorpha]|uniref:neural cell adhesion molecule 1-like isoform X3 n=1 Tax=Dreissena polymorpha TaxID=45954 RepID=UPI002264DB28|nr:neural cell adhesion molecule 1-like isoform X3 [Dreissena polymorpha]
MLETGQTNTLIASISHARCEYDATVYRCQGGSIHSTETQERELEVFIKCAPRPSPFYPPVTNISRTLNGSAVLTFTIKAYPKPDISAYSWYRLNDSTWASITDVNSVQSVSADGLQTNLSIPRLQTEDFGRYRVTVFNELGNATQEYELRAHDKPETPKKLHVKEGSLGVDSFTVEWEPGYHGGEDQTFVILYKAKQSALQWTDVNVSSNTLNYSIVGLKSGTTYLIKMFAINIAGKSEETDVVTARTHVILADSPSLLTAVSIGTTVGGIFCITLSAVGVWCMMKRKHQRDMTKLLIQTQVMKSANLIPDRKTNTKLSKKLLCASIRFFH